MASIYKAACEVINRNECKESELSTKDYCCLCFDPLEADADATQVEDKVVYDSVYGPCTEKMTTIALKVLGYEYAENITIFSSICSSCSKSVIASYKFIMRCKNSSDQFTNALENLSDCFNNLADNCQDYHTMFVSINTTDLTIEQLYDNKQQLNKKTAYPRFYYLANGRRIKYTAEKNKGTVETETNENKKRRKRDFSTIFIKTHELMADPKSKEYKCKLCMKTYPTSGSLRIHFFSMHFKKDYQCSLCPKSFGTSGLLSTHEKECHTTITCDDCGKKLLNRTSTIKRHLMTHETKKKICPRCGRSYKKSTDYQRHVEQDTCDLPSKISGNFVCDHCGKTCHFKHQLTAHLRFEHGGAKGHVCKWCGRKCYNQSALKVHILKHTGEKNFICDECGGKFVTKQSLLNHTRLHTGEKPYPCMYCDQSFLSASRRKEHIERHHTDATFECDLCDAKYSARRSLLGHRKRHFVPQSES